MDAEQTTAKQSSIYCHRRQKYNEITYKPQASKESSCLRKLGSSGATTSVRQSSQESMSLLRNSRRTRDTVPPTPSARGVHPEHLSAFDEILKLLHASMKHLIFHCSPSLSLLYTLILNSSVSIILTAMTV